MTGADPEAMVDVRVEGDGWGDLDCEALAARCFMAVEAAFPDMSRPVCVLFTDKAAMKKLNENFRGKNKPANVLSFPPGDGFLPEHDYLGDIALGFEICRDEALAEGVKLGDHIAHLLVHGMLHLIGYDHQGASEAEEMERREAEILKPLGITDPYMRAAAPAT